MPSRQEQLEYVLDLANNPSHNYQLPDANLTFSGGNPGCGDVVTLFLKLNPETQEIEEISFEMVAESCTISRAGSSYITDEVAGRKLSEVDDIHAEQLMNELGRDVVNSRPRCATLALGTLHAALKQWRADQTRATLASERQG